LIYSKAGVLAAEGTATPTPTPCASGVVGGDTAGVRSFARRWIPCHACRVQAKQEGGGRGGAARKETGHAFIRTKREWFRYGRTA
jgi:hypothetical protein